MLERTLYYDFAIGQRQVTQSLGRVLEKSKTSHLFGCHLELKVGRANKS